MVHALLLNFNGADHTIECLESLVRADYPRLRIVVCDNGSADGSVDRIERWARDHYAGQPGGFEAYDRIVAEAGGTEAGTRAGLVLISIGANLGFAGGNNVGIRYLLASGATGLVWLFNNDMVARASALRLMVDRLNGSDRLGCVGATLLEYHDPQTVQAAGGGVTHPWQGLPRPHSAAGKPRGSPAARNPDRVDFISMGCMLVPIRVMRQVGLIDERFFIYCEDIDYSFRLVKAGYELGFVADAEVLHKGSATMIPGSPFHDYHMVLSSLLLVRKHFARWFPLAFLYSVGRCLLPKLVRLQGTRLTATLRALVAAVRQPDGRHSVMASR